MRAFLLPSPERSDARGAGAPLSRPLIHLADPSIAAGLRAAGWALALVLFPAAHAAAQYPAELAGRVTDAVSGSPVEQVLVELPGTGVSALSDGRGEFHIRGLEPGRHSVRLSRIGYATVRRQVELSNGRRSWLAVRLPPQPVSLKEVRGGRERSAYSGATVITRDEIERSGARTAADVLSGRAGVVIDSRGPAGPGLASIRGSAPDQVLVLLDGAPLNGPLTGAADLSGLPAEGIESITVLRGGQSARFGPGAAAGVILIESRASAAPLGLRLGGGSFGRVAGDIEAAGRLGTFTWSAGGQGRRLEGRYGFDRPDALGGGRATRLNSDLSEASGFLAIDGPLLDGRLQLRTGHTRLERGLPGLSFQPATRARERLARWRGGAAWEREAERARISANLHTVVQRTRFVDPAPPVGLPYDEATSAWTLGGRLTAELRPDGPFDVVSVGLEARRHRYEGDALPQAPDGRTDLGAFLATETSSGALPAGIRLTTALRLDRDDLAERWRASHEILARVRTGPLGLRVRHASSYSPPAFGDQFFKEGVAVRPNPDLRAERIPAELSAGTELGGTVLGMFRGRLDLEAYRADVKDMIIWAPDFRFVWSPRNFDVRRRGLDAEGELALIGTGLRLGANYSYTRATYDRPGDDAVQVIYRPRHTAALDASWQPGRWQLGAELHYVGTRYPVPAPVNALEPFWTLDLRVDRSFAIAGWTVAPALRVDRLFDNESSLIFSYPEPGRIVRLEVSVDRE